MLESAANSVKAFPGRFAAVAGYDVNSAQQKLYSALRDKTNAFVDKQLYSIKKVKSLIAQALSSVGQGSKRGKDLMELQGKFEELFPLPADVPPQGRCKDALKDETFKMFKSGKYKDKDILTEVLGGSDDELKEEFLGDIGFASITSFREAQIHAADINPDDDRLLILKKAALEDYVKQAEQLARQNPNGPASYTGTVNQDLLRINDASLARLIAQPLSVLMPLPPAGALTNQARAQRLRAELTRLQIPFSSGVYLKGYKMTPAGVRSAVLTLIHIDEVRKACELDGNVGQGTEQTGRILSIVAALKGLTEPTKEERNPLTDFVEFLKTKRIVDDRGELQDKSRPFTTLATRGFSQGDISRWRLMEVSKKDKKTNAVQTFLTLHSGYFRSIGYDESAIYKGKREADIRKKYTEFAADLLKKEYSIEADDKDFWKKIADEFDMNFTFYKMVDGRGVADQTLDTRPGVAMYNIYETSDGFYYPIAMTNEAFEAAAPVATRDPALGLRVRQAPFGGAIEGVQMNVGPSVQEEKATKSAAAAATRQAYLDSASQKWAAMQTAVSNRIRGTPEYQLATIKQEGAQALAAIPADDRLPEGILAEFRASITQQREAATAANGALAAINTPEQLETAKEHRDRITAARDRVNGILANYRRTAAARVVAERRAAAEQAAQAPAAAEQAADNEDNPFAQGGRGRRRTNNAWLRSKPVRYTRRKFYK